MCGCLGVRCSYSHAYNHRANGRAERAGQQIFERLRRSRFGPGVTWVDVLPQILDRLHDTPGEAGFSPYQILFGRERPLAGLPYQPPVVCEDAKVFFERQKIVDQAVAKLLNDKHLKKEAWLNQRRTEQPPFLVRDLVWYFRPLIVVISYQASG